MISFEKWIAYQATRQDAVGDLARDLAADPTWPRDDQGDVLDHLYDAGADLDAISAVARALDEYIQAGGTYLDHMLRHRLSEHDVRIIPGRFPGQHDIAIVLDGGYTRWCDPRDLDEMAAHWRELVAQAFPAELTRGWEGM